MASASSSSMTATLIPWHHENQGRNEGVQYGCCSCQKYTASQHLSHQLAFVIRDFCQLWVTSPFATAAKTAFMCNIAPAYLASPSGPINCSVFSTITWPSILTFVFEKKGLSTERRIRCRSWDCVERMHGEGPNCLANHSDLSRFRLPDAYTSSINAGSATWSSNGFILMIGPYFLCSSMMWNVYCPRRQTS